jgi:hypothetical protein
VPRDVWTDADYVVIFVATPNCYFCH